MTNINSAEIVNYNANTRGTRTGDCTARAISLAFNIDYRKARKALNDSAKTNWRWNYNTNDNVWKVINELGGGQLHGDVEKVSVNDFADSHNQGTYIIWCTKDGISNTGSHLVTIINGKVYDSWDSRKYFVKGYWIIDSGIHVEDITDIQEALKVFFKSRDINQYTDYASDVIKGIIDKNRKLKKMAEEYDLDITFQLKMNSINYTTYSVTFKYTITVELAESDTTDIIYSNSYKNKLAIVYKPTMTSDQIQTYFDKVFYSKSYDFMHTIVDKVLDVCKGRKFLESFGQELPPEYDLSGHFRWDKKSEKSFNRLPYWVRRIATNFYINRYDSWGDTIQEIVLIINTPPFDTEYEKYKGKTRRFEAETMDILKEMLQKYESDGNFDEANDIRYKY